MFDYISKIELGVLCQNLELKKETDTRFHYKGITVLFLCVFLL